MTPSGKILFALYITCLFPLLAFSQQFNYTTALDKVATTGFYSITISPQLSSYIKTDASDIRIADEKKRWVPHILQPGKAVVVENLLTAFPIIQNTVTDSGKNLLIIENTKGEGIYNLNLFLKNSAVSRTAILSGSNNQHDWYIIDDKISISRSYETVKDEYLQEINFPLAKYRYLKIIIDNMHYDPLLITKAGFYAQPNLKKLNIYQDNPMPVFTQKDSNNYSYIEVRQQKNYQFDKISLVVIGSKFYNRDVQVCFADYGKNNLAQPGAVMGNFKLTPASPAVFELATRANTAHFFIVIKNADNLPLKIENVRTHQLTFSLVTYLEQGKRYNLLLGDSLASLADYDLQSFKDSITILHPLSYGNIIPIKNSTLKNVVANNNWWIWPSIIFAGIVLSFLTYRLAGDINKSKK